MLEQQVKDAIRVAAAVGAYKTAEEIVRQHNFTELCRHCGEPMIFHPGEDSNLEAVVVWLSRNGNSMYVHRACVSIVRERVPELYGDGRLAQRHNLKWR